MPRPSIALLAAALAASTTPALAQDQDGGRKMYALIESVPEYCPGIEKRFGITGAVKYDAYADGETEKLRAAKQEWFAMFRRNGTREAVCEIVMEQYGPGADPQLFQFE